MGIEDKRNVLIKPQQLGDGDEDKRNVLIELQQLSDGDWR